MSRSRGATLHEGLAADAPERAALRAGEEHGSETALIGLLRREYFRYPET